MDIHDVNPKSDAHIPFLEFFSGNYRAPPASLWAEDMENRLESLLVSIKTYTETQKPSTVDDQWHSLHTMKKFWVRIWWVWGEKKLVSASELERGFKAGADTQGRETVEGLWKRLEEDSQKEIGQDNWLSLVNIAEICAEARRPRAGDENMEDGD